MKKVIIISVFLLFTQLLVADQNDTNLSKYIGGAFGLSTGYGLSYRYWPGDWGGQIVFAPYSDGEDYTINLGTGVFRTLHETKNTRLFLYSALNGTYSTFTEYGAVNDTEDKETHLGGTLGLGPGMEIYIFDNIAVNFMFGYKLSIGSGQIAQTGLGFTFETALYYRF